MSSNNELIVEAAGAENFRLAMQLAFNDHKKAVGYVATPKEFVLFWTPVDPMSTLPFDMDWSDAADFAWKWLTKSADYGREPDQDGSNERNGFRFGRDYWGHAGRWETIIKIEPRWAMYGK